MTRRMAARPAAGWDPPMRNLNPDIVCAIVLEAREFHAKVEIVDPSSGSNPSDEAERGVLQDSADDPVGQDLRRLIRDLDDDAAAELVALFWIGRGDYAADELDAAIEEARRHGRDATPRYLIAQPQLADFLVEGLQAFGQGCDDVESEHF
jgi:hypothetical protein